MSKRALGRGLDALLAEAGGEGPGGSTVRTVPISALKVSGTQPRKSFSEEALEELARSIESKGVLQPILVTPSGHNEYVVVAGERRLRAARLAHLQEVPVLVRSFDELERTEIALIENLQREDLTPVEEAEGYRTLIEVGRLTQEQVARRVGKTRSAVANSLRLLRLSAPILGALDTGRISSGHARALLSVEREADRQALFRRILDHQLSVRAAEKLVAELRRSAERQTADGLRSGDTSRAAKKSPELRSLEQRLVERLGTKATIRGTDLRGRVEISYYSAEDLDRLCSLLLGEG